MSCGMGGCLWTNGASCSSDHRGSLAHDLAPVRRNALDKAKWTSDGCDGRAVVEGGLNSGRRAVGRAPYGGFQGQLRSGLPLSTQFCFC